jgi:hypothetical protein
MREVIERMDTRTGEGKAAADACAHITGRAEREVWSERGRELGEDAAAVHSSLGLSAMMLIELAEDLELGELSFEASDEIGTRPMLNAVQAAVACITRALDESAAPVEAEAAAQ